MVDPQIVSMSVCAITHVFTHLQALGGVQSIIRRHLGAEESSRFRHRALVFFERPSGTEAMAPDRLAGLGLHWYNSGLCLRRRFRRLKAFSPDVSIYHNLWGLGTVADLDAAPRRLGMLHSPWVGAEFVFRAANGLLDGVLCVSEPIVELARTCLPGLAPERIRLIPIPVDPPREKLDDRIRNGAELVLGFSGRVTCDPKRVERLPEIGRYLAAAGVAHRWEILGDGPDRALLERAFRQTGLPVTFHGMQSGLAYWRALSRWDAIVFASDFEGLPLTLLEALSQGVLPVFPRLPSGGREYTERVAPELVYARADPAAAAKALGWLQHRSLEERERLRLRALELAALHAGDAYDRVFTGFIQEIRETPRVSSAGPSARRRYPGEYFPYGFINRLSPDHLLRRGYM